MCGKQSDMLKKMLLVCSAVYFLILKPIAESCAYQEYKDHSF